MGGRPEKVENLWISVKTEAKRAVERIRLADARLLP